MVRKPVIAVLAVSLLLCACEQVQSWTGQTRAANEPNSAAEIGDNGPRTAAMRRAYTAPIGQQITWSNPQNGHSGTITAVKDGYNAQGAYCREFQQTVTAGSPPKQAYGTSCQQPDGSWKIASQQ